MAYIDDINVLIPDNTTGDISAEDLRNSFLIIQQNIDGSSGATVDRPADPRVGLYYFDTDLNVPVWFNGTNWTNANGVVL